MARTTGSNDTVTALQHDEAKRKNIPTAEYQSVMQKNEQDPVRVAYERRPSQLREELASRNTDLDPQLVWRGKDEQDWSDLVVHAPPLYIQEKVHPKALIDDLRHFSPLSPGGRGVGGEGEQLDLFADFNGIPQGADKTDFYQHDQNWSNRMILGDSLQVTASLAEREGSIQGMRCSAHQLPRWGRKMNTISARGIRRRGISAMDELLKEGPVHVTKNNRPTYVVMRDNDYARLIGRRGLWELLEQPARGARSKKDIDAELRSERECWSEQG